VTLVQAIVALVAAQRLAELAWRIRVEDVARAALPEAESREG